MKELFVKLMDLEKAYDKVNSDTLLNVLWIYGVGRKWLEIVRSLYKESMVCQQIGREKAELFYVNAGLQQVYVMSPWLFNLFMDEAVKKVKG